jgi:hypothetical protein
MMGTAAAPALANSPALNEGRGKLCVLRLAVQAEVKYSARAGER